MLNINRPGDPKDSVKSPLKPAMYEPPAANRSSTTMARAPSAPAMPSASPRESLGSVPVASHPLPPPLQMTDTPPPMPMQSETPGSKLFVGVNIKLKGVEISDCDVLVIEGQVEATVHSKQMEVSQPGTLHGTALIDVAEVHGEFSGELTARTRLIVHGTGRVSGTIRYGKLVVEEGGELSGDVKRIDADAPPQRTMLAGSHTASHSRHQGAAT